MEEIEYLRKKNVKMIIGNTEYEFNADNNWTCMVHEEDITKILLNKDLILKKQQKLHKPVKTKNKIEGRGE